MSAFLTAVAFVVLVATAACTMHRLNIQHADRIAAPGFGVGLPGHPLIEPYPRSRHSDRGPPALVRGGVSRGHGLGRPSHYGSRDRNECTAPQRIRYEAGERFTRGDRTVVIVKDLRVSGRSVERRRRAWRAWWEGGMDALATAGPPKSARLSDGRFAESEKELALGPAGHGGEDQGWTPARITAVIAFRFRTDCSMAAVQRLLHRHGWSWQCPWVYARGAGAGPVLAPRVDRRHVLLPAGRGIPVDPPVHRPHRHRHRQYRGTGRDGFSWRDYHGLVVRARIQLGAPTALTRDSLHVHRAAGMREYAAAHDWLTIVQLPSCAPDLNPVEGIWSLLRRGPPADTAFTDDEHLERTPRRSPRHIQLRPDLIDGRLAGTGLTLTQRP